MISNQGVIYQDKLSPKGPSNEEPGLLVDVPAVYHPSPLDLFSNRTDMVS
jgi:hypothetical protein